MNNLNINPIKTSENKFLSLTPKFSQALLESDKDKENFMNSSEEIKTKTQVITSKKISPFKNDFSLSSIFNEKNNESDNKNLINIKIENPSKKRNLKQRELISFGDKIDNEISLNNDNEIIYKEKENTSSVLSNKDKEKEKENNNDLEYKNSSSNMVNNSGSFQYNLPLDNDKAPTVKDFFIFDDDENTNNNNNKDNNNNKNISKEKTEKDKNEEKDNNIINNDNSKKKEIIPHIDSNITYSKKQAKRSKTQRQSILNEIPQLPLEDNFIAMTKKHSKKNLLDSCPNSIKTKKRIKFCINTVSKENIREKNSIQKLRLIKKLKLLNLPKINEDDLPMVNSYSSRDNLQKRKNNINYNNSESCSKKFKNLKFLKFQTLFTNFQKFKKNKIIVDEPSNTFRENINYKKINISKPNNAINYNNRISGKNLNNNNNKNYIIKKINNTNKIVFNRNGNNFNNSHKLFNNVFYKTVNYENNEAINQEKQNKNKININAISRNKPKFHIHKSFQNYQNSLKFQKINYKYNNNNKSIKNFNNNTLNKLNESNNNHYTKKKKIQKKFYNKFIYNVFDTNNNSNINNNKIIKTLNTINNNSSPKINKIKKIKVNMILNKPYNKLDKINAISNMRSQKNINNLNKIYRKPKNTCLANQFGFNDYNTINVSRKKFFYDNNNNNLTERNSVSKFEKMELNNFINNNGSMKELNINLDKIYKDIGSENILKFSILRNNLNNKISNEFSITVSDKKKDGLNTDSNHKDLKNKKTIINVNQYYPNYFINANNNSNHNSEIKGKK